LQSIRAFQTAQRAHFAQQPDEAKKFAPGDWPEGTPAIEAAVWTATARVVLNLDEMITRE
jgi:hypothetical protein